MIDIENEIFTRIVTELRSRFPDINVYGEDVRTPSSFPCVSIVEADIRRMLAKRKLLKYVVLNGN